MFHLWPNQLRHTLPEDDPEAVLADFEPPAEGTEASFGAREDGYR